VTLEGYEALKILADGQATKIVVPSEIQNISGLLASVSEVIKTDTPKSQSATAKKEVAKETTAKKTK